MNKNFAIAYLDKNGNGYSQNEPWLLNDFDNKDECFIKAKEMIAKGYKDVTIFELDVKLPETISWEYVRKRKFNSY